jgi:hypothetical protein
MEEEEEEEAGMVFHVQACRRLSFERCNRNVDRLVSMYLLLRRGVEGQNRRELLGRGAIVANFCCFGRYAAGEWFRMCSFETAYGQVTIVERRCSYFVG